MTLDRSPHAGLGQILAAARNDRVLLKRGGRPIALVIGVEDKDEEQIELENNPHFWAMIERSRHEPTIPFEQVRAEINGKSRRHEAGEPKRATKTKKKKHNGLA